LRSWRRFRVSNGGSTFVQCVKRADAQTVGPGWNSSAPRRLRANKSPSSTHRLDSSPPMILVPAFAVPHILRPEIKEEICSRGGAKARRGARFWHLSRVSNAGSTFVQCMKCADARAVGPGRDSSASPRLRVKNFLLLRASPIQRARHPVILPTRAQPRRSFSLSNRKWSTCSVGFRTCSRARNRWGATCSPPVMLDIPNQHFSRQDIAEKQENAGRRPTSPTANFHRPAKAGGTGENS